MPRLFATVPLLVFPLLLGCTGKPASADTTRGETQAAMAPSPQATALLGQLLLPGEGGRRGVEVHVWMAEPGGEERQLWILPDGDGRFAQAMSGALTRVHVSAGSDVHRMDASDLPAPDDGGQIDLGTIDLRERLVERRVRVRATEAAPDAVVRVGLWIGPPQTGPQGELPSLGSKQFPTVELGREVAWLLPPDAGAVHFLVERPDGPDHATTWPSGAQQVFGPYESSAFPLDLVLD
ncbi:MAG: hypothetical protein AAF089_18235 [Bacteroidota bacterium]